MRHLGRTIPNVNTNLPPLGPGGCGVTMVVAFPSACQPYNAQLPFVNSIQLLTTTFDSSGVPTNAGNFGRITTTNAFYTPRDIQFALKLIF